ncbi:MAG: hypothetical protein GY679_04070 [Mycoplasma sp.]|nr:hypothetical protein [Mycoplasma sp.]
MTSDYLELAGAANCCAGTVGLEAVGALNVAVGNAVTEYKELAGVLNQLAGTTGLEATAAANVWAGTTGLELVGALNVKCAGSGTWDPRSLTDLAAWYEPDLDAGLRAVVDMVPDTATGGAFGTTLFTREGAYLDEGDTTGPTGVDSLTAHGTSQNRTVYDDAGVHDGVIGATMQTAIAGKRISIGLRHDGLNGNQSLALRVVSSSLRLYVNNSQRASVAIPSPTDGNPHRVVMAVMGNRVRGWMDDVLYIEHTLSTADLAALLGRTAATWGPGNNESDIADYLSDLSVRTVDPTTDFDEDSSAPGDVGLTDVDASITANNLYVSAVDGTGTDGIEATRSGSDIVISADSGTIATVTDPGSSGDDLRIIRHDVGVWVYSNADLASALTLSAPDAAAASGGYTDGTEAAPPPLVTVLPDLSGQHQHAVQTDDGTDQGAGATTDRRPLLLPNFTDGGTSALVGNDDATAYLVGPDLALSVPWSYASAIRATANNRADMGSQGLRWYAKRAGGDFRFYGGATLIAPSPDVSRDQHVQYLTHGATGRIRLDGEQTLGTTGTESWNQGFHLMARDSGTEAYEGDDNLAAALFSDVDEASKIGPIELHLSRHTTWTP